MQFEKVYIDGLIVIAPKVFHDERGHFFESFNKKLAIANGLNLEFVQENESWSRKGALRGLHFQKGEHAQAKLVRVIKGTVLDVAVDIRPGSSTFGKHYSIELSDVNKKQFYIPRGFAHGFITLSEEAILQYKCDSFFCKEAEGGINFDDQDLEIEWGMPKASLSVNERDRNFPMLKNLKVGVDIFVQGQ